ncbi:hypothetical protein [Paraflavitalea sp. CAU 1676]|uniref:hypothetical protein n=1 Tax=Paraflavitalea sp. CAU 1676 TaxID=3032598 RepID=UPI0023DA5B20|nr:hypothetical protein [Paraflavitalea sp. CAU 1676]MDF2187496.1 hypothetical protein [Paraflavitalea sp. CAU 1676]
MIPSVIYEKARDPRRKGLFNFKKIEILSTQSSLLKIDPLGPARGLRMPYHPA